MFPWARGNLQQFWQRDSLPPITTKHVHWLLTQCRGLATGIRKIHQCLTWPKRPARTSTAFSGERKYGTHGDIKPQNILFFDSDEFARLVITDFGLSRINSTVSRSNVPANACRGFTYTYMAPEHDLGSSIGQKCDIWSLGCLYLEFVTWSLHGGYHAVLEFNSARFEGDTRGESDASIYHGDEFHTLHPSTDDREQSCALLKPHSRRAPRNGTARLKDAVRKVGEIAGASWCAAWWSLRAADSGPPQWIASLRERENCSQAYHQFLDMIEDHLLVPDQDLRWCCDQMCAEFDEVLGRCTDNEEGRDFMIKGMPRMAQAGVPATTDGTKVLAQQVRFRSRAEQAMKGCQFLGPANNLSHNRARSLHGQPSTRRNRQRPPVQGRRVRLTLTTRLIGIPSRMAGDYPVRSSL
jgi:serine/threonine protein kinase